MEELLKHIDHAAPFQPEPATEMPIVDQSSGIDLALQMAQRASQPKPEPAAIKSLGAVPIPN